MNQSDEQHRTTSPAVGVGGGSRKRRWAAVTGLLAAGAVTGGVLAGTIGASAATPGSASSTPNSTSSTTSGTADVAATAQPAMPPRSSTPVRGDEKSVSAAVSATLGSKALAAVPGGTVYRIETDAGDAAYEAHMTKADGTAVTVKFDSSLNLTAVEDAMGKGDPAPPGGPGQGPADRSPGTTSADAANTNA